MMNLLYISCGAALGASLRWGLNVLFTPLFSTLALGTLLANYLGCLIMGAIIALIWQYPQFSPEWRLFLITGFLGSLTTFSAFSGEVIENLLHGRWVEGLSIATLHIFGCLCLTFVGFWLGRYLQT